MGLIELRAPRAAMFVDAMERVLYLGAIVCDDRHRGWPPANDDRASGPPAHLSHDENPTRWLRGRLFMGQPFYEELYKHLLDVVLDRGILIDCWIPLGVELSGLITVGKKERFVVDPRSGADRSHDEDPARWLRGRFVRVLAPVRRVSSGQLRAAPGS